MSNKVKYEFKDFINIKDTFNGSIDNVRMEGNTIINLIGSQGKNSFTLNSTVRSKIYELTQPIQANTDVFIRVSITSKKAPLHGLRLVVKNDDGTTNYYNGFTEVHDQMLIRRYPKNITHFGFYMHGDEFDSDATASITFEKAQVTLENVGTSYFEGLKSVGELEELEITSCNTLAYDLSNVSTTEGKPLDTSLSFKVYGKLEVNETYSIMTSGDGRLYYGGSDCGLVKPNQLHTFVLPQATRLNDKYPFSVYRSSGNENIINENTYVTLLRGNHSELHSNKGKSDKKKLLYKDNDGTWKPVVLRKSSEDCKDYIEQLADGTYRYHRKCGEDTWKGTEGFGLYKALTNTLFIRLYNTEKYGNATYEKVKLICDKIKSVSASVINTDSYDEEGICIWNEGNQILFKILKSKLPTQDLAGVKSYITQNNFTIVYPLKQEEVYECVNLNLQSFDGETSIFTSSTIPTSCSCEIEFPNQIKAELHVAKQDYDKKYTALKNIINTLITEGKVTPENQTKYNNAYTDYSNSVSNLNVFLQKGLDVISNTKINNSKFEIMKEVSDMDKALTDLDVVMNGAFKDGVLSDSEKQAIQQHIQIVNTEKADIEKQYANLYANTSLIGTPKTNLKSAYDSYISNHTNLLNTINTILNKTGLVDSTDQTNLNNSFKNYRDASGLYTQRVSEALDSIGTKKTADAKASLQKEISDVNKAVGNLEDTMEGVFKDGVLSDSEKLAVKQSLQIVQNEKADVDKDYATTYANVNLTGTAKTNLKSAYDDYVAKYNALVTVINDFVNKTTIIDSVDQTKLNTAFTNYRTANGLYSQRVNEAINSIGKKMADDSASTVDKKYADIIIGEDGILSQVGSIKTKVDKVKTDFDNLEIGGRNLIKNSNFSQGTTYWRYLDGVIDYQGKKCAYQTMKETTGETFIASSEIIDGQLGGKQITLSFLGACTPNMKSFEVFVLSRRKNSASDFDYADSKRIELTSNLIKYVWTITLKDDVDSLYIRFDNNGSSDGENATLYITEAQIETGNKVTAWREAPEDTEQNINDQISNIHDTISKVSAENNATAEQMLKDALLDYVTTGEYNSFYEVVQTQFTQTNSRFDMTFSEFKGMIEETIDGLEQTTSEIIKYISFDNGDIILGNSNSNFTLKITNEKIQFMDGGNEIAYISNQKLFITDAEITNSLQIGSFKWLPRANGNLSFVFIEGGY